MTATLSAPQSIESWLGEEGEDLLIYQAKVSKQLLHLPGPDSVERIFAQSDRNPQVLRSLQQLYSTGRLANTGYLSILPVDQGIEHSAGASFAPNPMYFDPKTSSNLRSKAVAMLLLPPLGVLGMASRKYAHRIPFIMKLNHNELLTYPNQYDQIMFASVEQAWNLGAVAVGATIYFGSEQSTRQIQEVSRAFARAHELGMATILWCYLRNSAFKQDDKDYHLAADLTGQANHLGVTIEADIIKQKLPENNNAYGAIGKTLGAKVYGKTNDLVYSELSSDHPIDLTRYQVLNCYSGRAGLINSGGASGKNDFAEAIRTAVINKRAGGTGLISGRKTFQRPFEEGVKLFHAIQDVYLSSEVTIA
jgi:class I fructose-bisphosphate aldolase